MIVHRRRYTTLTCPIVVATKPSATPQTIRLPLSTHLICIALRVKLTSASGSNVLPKPSKWYVVEFSHHLIALRLTKSMQLVGEVGGTVEWAKEKLESFVSYIRHLSRGHVLILPLSRKPRKILVLCSMPWVNLSLKLSAVSVFSCLAY